MKTVSERPYDAIRAARRNDVIRVADLPGSPEARRKAVSRAVANGELVKVARGVYYKGKRTAYGMTRPATDKIIEAVVDRGAGPAGHSAARAWGVTTQVTPNPQIAVLKMTTALKDAKFVHRSNLARIDLNAREIALLELLRDPDAYVESGWKSLVDAVAGATGSKDFSVSRVAKAVRTERDRATRENFARLDADLALAA